MTPLSEIEKQLVKKKDWLYTGEVDSKKRPLNSLLSTKDIDFEVADQFEPISSKQNSEIQRLTLQRLREGTFDNFSFNFKEEICVEEEEDVLDLDLVTLFNEIEGELIKISDFGSIGFLPDVKIKIKEEKIKGGKVKEGKKKVKNLEKVKNVTVLK
ncbi:hypothetical protein NBO_28g0074 [Nosema bombycis CQ1]|uniref:Uncharacterized protein n=1 Tax=Nosema bombycis (strain CQ1 / CVCC 102059) TaxID=578461 RepID=R0MJQ2_NOSB1|nr:hypothetical protein NBO_28g0074 [Nosema bombycis CQ1]|eukprot:EOB14435.1 hypothetical protein NBO_28g0074 [Nosema bombycis CQ1]